MATIRYPAIVEPADGAAVGIWFPDFDGCVSAADHIGDAPAMSAEALALHIRGMTDDGDPIPHPSDPNALGLETDLPLLALLMIPVEVAEAALAPVPNERVNVILPRPLLKRIDDNASQRGQNRSEWLAHAARERLGRRAGGG